MTSNQSQLNIDLNKIKKIQSIKTYYNTNHMKNSNKSIRRNT